MNSMHEAVYSTIPRDVIKRVRKEETMSELHVILNRTLQQLERKNAKIAELYERIAQLETQIMEKGVEQ